MNTLSSILLLLGGLGAFLVGLKMMGDNLQTLAGNRLKPLFNKVSNNRFMGIATGAGVTAVIQSSSATTVMVVGFVNAGIMTLKQATGIIMGANIGTTITAHITALQSLPITPFLTALACVGAFMAMSSKDKIAKTGLLIGGIGIIFVGMKFMSSAMESVSENPQIESMLTSISNPFLLMFIGLAITALIQSSSATTSILITLGTVGMMTLRNAIFMTLGINIGTCVTAMLASIGASTNAKRASMIHLLFNIFGCIIFTILIFVLPLISPKLAFDYWLPRAFSQIGTQIAMFHTIFNVVATIVLVPFTSGLTKLSTLIIRDKKTEDNEHQDKKYLYIDERLLKTPSIALLMLRREIVAMAKLAKENLEIALNILTTLNFDKEKEFAEREQHIDYLNKQLTKYAVKISAKDISYQEEKEIASFYHVISDIERVGDYAENLCEYAHELADNNTNFSAQAIDELKQMHEAINHLYENSMLGFEHKSFAFKELVDQYENEIDEYESTLSKNHIARLNNNVCNVESGSVFLSTISNLERIGDHIRNIFNSMSTYVSQSVKTKANIKEDIDNIDDNNSDIDTEVFPSHSQNQEQEELNQNSDISTAQVDTNKKD